MKVDFSVAIKGIFDNKESYKDFTQKDKEDNFFIINRYMAKNHPMMCQELNDKGLPKDICMDIWSRYFKNVNKAPFWFWKKATKKEDIWPNSFKNADVKRLEFKEELDKESLMLLLNHYPKECKFEIDYINDLIKDQK
jgi:hypothetical protein